LIIERVRIEEGFLDGLDIDLRPGLNTLIGARGAGKTSLIELIRFCLDVPSFTSRSAIAAERHARAVLDTGRVTVTVQTPSGAMEVSRTVHDQTFRAIVESDDEVPIIMSQNEIELVGLDPVGRLRILDGFRTKTVSLDARERELLSSIRSMTVEITVLGGEMEGRQEQIAALTPARHEIERARREEAAALESLDNLRPIRERVEALGHLQARASVSITILERTTQQLEEYEEQISAVVQWVPTVESLDEGGFSQDSSTPIQERLHASKQKLLEALEDVEQAILFTRSVGSQARKRLTEAESEARELRRELEEAQQGAGDIARRIAQLQEQAAQLEALEGLRAQLSDRLQDLRHRRQMALDELDELRASRFQERTNIAAQLSRDLGPRIRVKVVRFGLFTEYASAIAASLRGSGLHYNTLAPVLAERISPRELIEAIETGDADVISRNGEIALDRAERLIAYVRGQGTEDILTASLDDDVTFQLLDGGEYKDTEHLSTGQRCTVILPILLWHKSRPVIIDQPEDHLDNAFVVDTLVEAIRRRSQLGQMLFSSHNANIPVLGEASQVILLNSDGRRGFVERSGPLSDSAIVRAITSVMEGGLEAFRRRAAFYRARGVLDAPTDSPGE
jgi:ABC-type dipeptide/oligopeptide/nickel transport system ATPase component